MGGASRDIGLAGPIAHAQHATATQNFRDSAATEKNLVICQNKSHSLIHTHCYYYKYARECSTTEFSRRCKKLIK